ncbi:MAG: hypothetical protein HC772_05030 [Leptolyngbyaceae cyanobacterium CRU_2_3]|nr:hypothetical protein [Leptolyngbyaceae cyanobacterium CRU_2_3]
MANIAQTSLDATPSSVTPSTLTPTPAAPGEILETDPVPPGAGTALPDPLDRPVVPPRAVEPGESVRAPGTPGNPPPFSISPDRTLPERTVPNPVTPNLIPGEAPPEATIPGESTPEPNRLEIQLPSSSSQAEPDRTPPGTFTPDTSGISPGRATRSGSSYLGIGGNIGLGSGDTALGEGSFSVFSKVGLTSNLSLRPNVLISDDPTILVPLTLDFIPLVTEATENLSRRVGLNVSPYIGAGVAISTGDDGAVDFLATGGVDVPISDRITATASVSATLFDNPAVGLLLGVGYNF